jgi:hypothetical protein
VRLAHANLTEAQAKELLPRLRPVPKDPLPPTPPVSRKDLDQLIEKYAKEYNLDAAEMRKNMDKASLQAAKLAEDVVQRVADQVPRILKAVGHPAEKDVQALRAKEAAAEPAALRDHWWVQRQDGETWLDWDMLLPNAEPGKSIAKAKETIAPNKDAKLVLPSKYCHEVNIRIVIEQWKNEKMTEKTVLSHTLRPSELFGQRIALNHYPMKWPKDLDLVKEKKPLEKLKSIVLAQDEWLPILTVGSEQFIQASFTDSGDTVDKPLAPLLGGGAQKLGNSIGGILGSGKIGAAPGRQSSTDSHLTAEWIDYEIRSPGRPVHKIRRQIFDLLGPAARHAKQKETAAPAGTHSLRLARGLALLGQRELLLTVCQLSDDFVQNLLARAMLDNRQIVLDLFNNGGSEELRGMKKRAGKISPLPGPLYTLALARDRYSHFGGSVYFDRPNILTYHTSMQEGSESRLSFMRGFDILANEVAVRKESATDLFHVRLGQGVLDTAAEGLIMAMGSKVINTAEIFAAQTAKNVDWFTIRNVRDTAWQLVEIPKDTRARIEQDLNAGYSVLVPRKTLSIPGQSNTVWWRVDPISGHTLGMSEAGGQATTEFSLLKAVLGFTIVFVACEFVLLGADNAGLFDVVNMQKAPAFGPTLWCAISALTIDASLIGGWGIFSAIGTIIAALFMKRLLGQS